MKKISLFNDDFRNHLDLFKQSSYVISDPPYNQGYHYSEYSDELTFDEYSSMLLDAFSGYQSVIISYPEETLNIVSKVMSDDWCEQSVSWVYNSNTAKQHRLISWWNCKPDMKRIGQDYKNPTDKRIAKRIAKGKKAKLYDWWYINQVKNVSKKENPHPCPVPLELMKRIILLTTKENDLIIDPFMGSGTTGLACKLLNRDFIGFEIDKKYFDYANKMLNNQP